MWFDASRSVIDEFDTIGKRLKILGVFPNPYPFYDWIMGFYERRSNRAALNGPVLGAAGQIIDVGIGTGDLLGRIVRKTTNRQRIVGVDRSWQMLENSRALLRRRGLLSSRVRLDQGDCTLLPYGDETFDLYVSSYLFDLLPDGELESALREMQRVLRPDGHAILVTMTTELHDVPWFRRWFYRATSEFYCLGYSHGRWNGIWRFLLAGYAPHCRPISLGKRLKKFPALSVEYSKTSRVSWFPVRIYYVRKRHA